MAYNKYVNDVRIDGEVYGIKDVDHRTNNEAHLTNSEHAKLTELIDNANTPYTKAEQTKLSGIETGANKYVLPSATQTVLGGIKIYNSGDTLYINT